MFRKHASEQLPSSVESSARKYRLNPKPSKRLVLLVILVYPACFAIFPGVAGMIQKSRFFAEVRHRQAMGERILPGDFVTIAPPDDQNAATYLLQAAPQLQLSDHQQWLINGADRYRLSKESKSFVLEFSEAHPQIWTLLHKAEGCPQVDWHVKWSSPAMQINESYLKGQRVFAYFLYNLGVCQHEAGDDAAAMQTARDLLFLARTLDTRSSFIAHLVARGPEHLGASLCFRLAYAANPSTARADEDLGVTALPLIADLCDDERIRRQFEAAVVADRMVSLDSIIHLQESKFDSFCLQFQDFSAAFAVLDDYDSPIRASALRSWPEANPLVPSEPDSKSVLVRIMGPHLRMPFVLEFESEAERHAAAIAIACRLYADDHGGKWPADLSSLVPHYLPAIPCDPFNAKLRPMKYLPGNPPAIYSISIDGIDNKGDRTGAIRYHDGFSYNPWLSPDAVFPIGGVVEPAEKRPPEEP